LKLQGIGESTFLQSLPFQNGLRWAEDREVYTARGHEAYKEVNPLTQEGISLYTLLQGQIF
jgi:hypothetical protein